MVYVVLALLFQIIQYSAKIVEKNRPKLVEDQKKYIAEVCLEPSNIHLLTHWRLIILSWLERH